MICMLVASRALRRVIIDGVGDRPMRLNRLFVINLCVVRRTHLKCDRARRRLPPTDTCRREDLGVPEVTTHSFRTSVATPIDDRSLSARIGADRLGHARPSMTQDVYMTRGKLHTQVAEALDDAINDQ